VPLLIAIIAIVLVGGYVYTQSQPSAPAGQDPSATLPTETTKNGKATTQKPPAQNPTKPSVAVVSPNGGETYKIGNVINMKWSTVNTPTGQNISIGLQRADKTGELAASDVISIIKNIKNTGSYDWTIPTSVTPAKYIAEIYTTDWIDGRGSDTSDAAFTISAATFATNEQRVLATARDVLSAFAARDYQKLEGLTSADGLGLSTGPHFGQAENLIPKIDIAGIPKDTKIYLWGYTDGKGDPINLTRAGFLTKYIYSADYLKAPDVAVNKTLGGGNSLNTIDKDVNGRTYVAFHFSGFDPKYGGMDWTTIYLIFDSVNGEYKLRGIAKDNWTI